MGRFNSSAAAACGSVSLKCIGKRGRTPGSCGREASSPRAPIRELLLDVLARIRRQELVPDRMPLATVVENHIRHSTIVGGDVDVGQDGPGDGEVPLGSGSIVFGGPERRSVEEEHRCGKECVSGLHDGAAPVSAAGCSAGSSSASAFATAMRTFRIVSGVTDIDVMPLLTRKGGTSSG